MVEAGFERRSLDRNHYLQKVQEDRETAWALQNPSLREKGPGRRVPWARGWGGEREAGLPSVLQMPAVSKTEGQGPGVTQPGKDAL